MRTGPLRHRLDIQRRDSTTTTVGGSRASWVTVHTKWAADIRPLSARELTAAQVAQSRVTHEITMRYVLGLTMKHRLLESIGSTTRYFEIASLTNPDERRIEHRLLAIESPESA